MRLTPWRAMQPKDAISGLDKDRLEERLAKLVGGPAAEATPAPAPVEESHQPDGGTTALVEVGVVPDAVALPVKLPKPGNGAATSNRERNRRRRRKAGFLLFFAGLILVFFLVR